MGCGASAKSNTKYGSKEGVIAHTDRISNRISEIDSHKAELPPYWSRQDNTAEHFQNYLECTSESPDEVKSVQDLIDMTLDVKAAPLIIERLIRLEDSLMWALYDQAIDHIEGVRSARDESPWMIHSPSGAVQPQPLTTRSLPDDLACRLRAYCNETYLWHGTNRESAEKILREGFDMTLCGGAHAKILGKGAYFAERVSLADRYAPAADDDGLHAMLLVRVALGKVFFTRRYTGWRGKKLVRLVSTSKLVKGGECDSVLGDRNRQFNALDIREYCIPNKSQLYPEYLVLYRREGNVDEVQPRSTSNGSKQSKSSDISNSIVKSNVSVFVQSNDSQGDGADNAVVSADSKADGPADVTVCAGAPPDDG